jgi:ribose 5-phosphate isomerase B
MKILIASDHAGLDLKQDLAAFITQDLGHEVEDLGTHDHSSCDYPLYAVAVAQRVAASEGDLGVLICGTGLGMSMAANKVPGAVAALCSECFSARMAREHNGANVLCLGARVLGPSLARTVVEAFLAATPDAGANHARRRELLRQLDERRTCEDR